MKFRIFAVFLLLFSGLLLAGCEKRPVEKAPPVDILTEEPYEEHLDELDENILIDSPQPNEAVTAPLVIKGQARGGWYFEATFPVRLVDDQGNEVAVSYAEAQENWMQEGFVPFKAVINSFKPGTSEQGTLILEKSNPSGLEEHADQIEIPVKIQGGETSMVKVYFPNSVKDPDFMDCGKVFVVERAIPKTQAVARSALEELLKGPSGLEKTNGYFTNLNSGVEIQRLVIEDGVAKVDFDEQMGYQVGGSCRIHSIYSQIETTLKQFPTVKEVEISIDGETEEILQP